MQVKGILTQHQAKASVLSDQLYTIIALNNMLLPCGFQQLYLLGGGIMFFLPLIQSQRCPHGDVCVILKRSLTPTPAERAKVAKTLPGSSTKLSWERAEHLLLMNGRLQNDFTSLWNEAPILCLHSYQPLGVRQEQGWWSHSCPDILCSSGSYLPCCWLLYLLHEDPSLFPENTKEAVLYSFSSF